jgi:DNA-binding transcriptional LysR family regulator
VELRQLLAFVAVAEELHFGRAAERLHIVQPAISQQLRRLEAELGLLLFDRSSRPVELTRAGTRLLPEARRVLAAADHAREVAAALADERATTIRIGTSTGLGGRLPRLLSALSGQAPEVRVELRRIRARERLTAVTDGGLDAAFVRGTASHVGLRLQEVWSDALLAAVPASHPAGGGREIRLSALADLPLLLPRREDNPALVDHLLAACREAGFEPLLAPSMPDQDMLAAIGAGRPGWTVYFEPQAEALAGGAPQVAFRPLTEPSLSMPTLLALPAEESWGANLLLAACAAVG